MTQPDDPAMPISGYPMPQPLDPDTATRLQAEFARMRHEDRELYEPDPDDLTRAELAEYAHLPWSAVAETLDDWLTCRQNERPGTNGHHVGTFLDLLAARGYRVTAIEPLPPIETLLGAPTE